jgi:hypothetical protein
LVSKPLDDPVFFLDRNLGKKLAATIRAAGCRVEIHDDHFSQDTEDIEWLREGGKRKWIFLTKDQNISRNQIEVTRLLESGSPAFAFTAGSVTSNELGSAFSNALPDIKKGSCEVQLAVHSDYHFTRQSSNSCLTLKFNQADQISLNERVASEISPLGAWESQFITAAR